MDFLDQIDQLNRIAKSRIAPLQQQIDDIQQRSNQSKRKVYEYGLRQILKENGVIQNNCYDDDFIELLDDFVDVYEDHYDAIPINQLLLEIENFIRKNKNV